MNTPMCVLCKNPTSLCQCSAEVRAFGDAHIHTHDGERALINGETLRVLIERAQAWGREQSARVVQPEGEAIDGLQAAWDAINGLIREGDLGGNGCDRNAERNGIILAANVIQAMIRTRRGRACPRCGVQEGELCKDYDHRNNECNYRRSTPQVER